MYHRSPVVCYEDKDWQETSCPDKQEEKEIIERNDEAAIAIFI